jgi:hypothetical protein
MSIPPPNYLLRRKEVVQAAINQLEDELGSIETAIANHEALEKVARSGLDNVNAIVSALQGAEPPAKTVKPRGKKADTSAIV